MENKLQQLTQKLYDEGLEKGRAEAERLVSEAKSEAAKIIADAKAEADAQSHQNANGDDEKMIPFHKFAAHLLLKK